MYRPIVANNQYVIVIKISGISILNTSRGKQTHKTHMTTPGKPNAPYINVNI